MEQKLCLGCMEEHPVSTVRVAEKTIYKGVEIEFTAVYEYCPETDTYIETEDMIRANSLAVKEAYQKKAG